MQSRYCVVSEKAGCPLCTSITSRYHRHFRCPHNAKLRTAAITIEFNLVTRHFIRSYFPLVPTMNGERIYVDGGENADGSLRRIEREH